MINNEELIEFREYETVQGKWYYGVPKQELYNTKNYVVVTDLNGKSYPYSILHFFKHNDFLDKKLTIYSDWLKKRPVKLRFDINKIGERKIFSMKFETTLYIHEEVKKAILKANCQGIYFYGIHKPGRLSP